MAHKIRFRIITSLCCFVVFFLSAAAYGQLWLEALDEQGNRLPNKQLHLYMMSHEFRALRFINHAENNGTTVDHRAFLMLRDDSYPIPDYVFAWEDKEAWISPGSRDSLENVLYIHPKEITTDTIRVYAGIRQGTSSLDRLLADQFMIYIHVVDSKYDIAKIIPEPEFTSGLTNTISWLSATDAFSQDAYFYDVTDPVYLFEAANGLYKTLPKDTLQTSFEGLISGSQYGYFVKSVFQAQGEKKTFYSDFVFSTQDNVAPDPIGAIQAIERFPGQIELSWGTVQDDISGVKAYRIYRGVDTGLETLIDSVMATSNDPDSLSWTETISGSPSFYYRVRAVDRVGNEGEGTASNAIDVDGNFDPDPNQSQNTAEIGRWGTVRPIIPFPIDTLWITLDGREASLRFQSVRDSVRFFEDKPNLDFRYFDSGWITPENLEKDPLDPTHCFYVFDYTQNGAVYDQFVNGHTYHRRFIRNYTVSADTFSLGQITPDLFPPDDISNLHVETYITDFMAENPLDGYHNWQTRLKWSPSEDHVSGLKRYHIYRKIQYVDDDFIELALNESFLQNQYIDSLRFTPPDIQNPKIFYRVAAEDSVGRMRDYSESAWLGEGRSLGAPSLALNKQDVTLYAETGPDTIFTKSGTVIYKIGQFDLSDVQYYIVSINGIETKHAPILKDTLRVLLPPDEASEIKVRALYLGKRSSIWSDSKWAIRALNRTPVHLTARNDSSWRGDMYLQWEKASLDLDYYEIWRNDSETDSVLIGKSSSSDALVDYTDLYAIDELTGEETVPLTAYQTYGYRVRQINLFGDVSPFTDLAEDYCNKPPVIREHSLPKIEDGHYVFTITWERPRPNLVTNNFQTLVYVYEDSLTQLIHQAIITDNDTTFTFRLAAIDHNYIFRIQERTNDNPQLKTAWSRPYTVSSLVKLEPFTVLPQPKGHIYLDWNSPDMIGSFDVDSFLVFRDETLLAGFANTVVSYMDSARYLSHKTGYTYTIFALDSLLQVVAANSKTGVCDTGLVFIPEILPFEMKYFNSDSVLVNWTWRDIDGNAISDTTRGAKTYWLQSSVSIDFPEESDQTVTFGPHEALASVTSRIIPVPPLGNQDNEQVYFRIRTEDAWGHPGETIWSTDFYPVKRLIYDPVFPNLPSDMGITSSQAYYHGPDSVIVTLEWSGSGVEYPKNNDASIYWDALIQNIHSYTLNRTNGTTIEQIGLVAVNPQKVYMVLDTMPNQQNRWQIVVTDSAQNQSSTGWFESQIFLPTPAPPVPLHHRGCTITPLVESSGPAEYAVEMALNPEHFAFAYELDEGAQIDRFLCQSGWLAGPKFVCTSGWGRIQVDSTWFRVKAGQEINGKVWESGWSTPSLYDGSDDGVIDPEESETAQIPEHFYVRSNYPNPFNMSTTIEYGLNEETEFSAAVFNLQGRKIKTLLHQTLSPGHYTVQWDGTDSRQSTVATGIYIIRIRAKSTSLPSYRNHMKVMLLK